MPSPGADWLKAELQASADNSRQYARIRYLAMGNVLFAAEPEMKIVARPFSWSHNSRRFPRYNWG
jgi:hypothetical protein